MPFDKVREVLMKAHKVEMNGEGKKKLAQALDLMKQAEDHKDLANEGNTSNMGNENKSHNMGKSGDLGDNGGNNSADQSPAALSEAPALKVADSLRFDKMPMKDLEAHVKMQGKKQSNSDGPEGMGW